MRLIDADELLKYMETAEISRYIDEINKGNDNYSSTALYDYIKEMPTAYNVDKVVERLEEKALNTSDTQIGISARMAFGKSVEIVKSGGISKE